MAYAVNGGGPVSDARTQDSAAAVGTAAAAPGIKKRVCIMVNDAGLLGYTRSSYKA